MKLIGFLLTLVKRIHTYRYTISFILPFYHFDVVKKIAIHFILIPHIEEERNGQWKQPEQSKINK